MNHCHTVVAHARAGGSYSRGVVVVVVVVVIVVALVHTEEASAASDGSAEARTGHLPGIVDFLYMP